MVVLTFLTALRLHLRAADLLIGPEFALDKPVLSPAPVFQSAPTSAFNGTDHLAVWLDSAQINADPLSPRRIMATRVDANGSVLDAKGIIVNESSGSPKAASNGDNWLVVWEARGSATDTDILGVRISVRGERL